MLEMHVMNCLLESRGKSLGKHAYCTTICSDDMLRLGAYGAYQISGHCKTEKVLYHCLAWISQIILGPFFTRRRWGTKSRVLDLSRIPSGPRPRSRTGENERSVTLRKRCQVVWGASAWSNETCWLHFCQFPVGSDVVIWQSSP